MKEGRIEKVPKFLRGKQNATGRAYCSLLYYYITTVLQYYGLKLNITGLQSTFTMKD